MNTLHDYVGSSHNEIPRDCKLKKSVLVERVHILTDVVQSLIEYISEKEKVQLGVFTQIVPSGLKYVVYESRLEEKPTP